MTAARASRSENVWGWIGATCAVVLLLALFAFVVIGAITVAGWL